MGEIREGGVGLPCVICGSPASRIVTGDVRDVAGVAVALPGGERVLCASCLAGDVPSPCLGVCQLDAVRSSCDGCGRSVTEISSWTSMTPAARAAVLFRLRRAQS